MPLDEKDIEKINALIAAGVGEALKGEAFTKTVGGAVGEAIKGLKLDETIASKITEGTQALTDKVKALEESGGGNKGGGKGGNDDDESEAMKALKKRLDEQERLTREAQEAAAAEKKKARTDRLHNAARDALAAAGVTRTAHALAFLKDQGLLTYDSDEADAAPGFRGENEYGQEAVVAMDKGIAAWLKTDDGKAYLPASDHQGNGDRGGRRSSGSSGATRSAESVLNNALGSILRF